MVRLIFTPTDRQKIRKHFLAAQVSHFDKLVVRMDAVLKVCILSMGFCVCLMLQKSGRTSCIHPRWLARFLNHSIKFGVMFQLHQGI